MDKRLEERCNIEIESVLMLVRAHRSFQRRDSSSQSPINENIYFKNGKAVSISAEHFGGAHSGKLPGVKLTFPRNRTLKFVPFGSASWGFLDQDDEFGTSQDLAKLIVNAVEDPEILNRLP